MSYAKSQEKYKYQLVESFNKNFCGHMTQIFNRNFQTPWNKGWLDPSKTNPTIFGLNYDQVFERLPGVQYNKEFTFSMLLSKFPSSAEFEAIPWKEGRVEYPDHHLMPVLIAKIDVNNSGENEWVIQDQFMNQIPKNEGMIRGNLSEEDGLEFFSVNDFDLNSKLTLNQIYHGQKMGKGPRRFGFPVGSQIRPFIYDGKVYFSVYKQFWKERSHKGVNEKYQQYPDREYMNILRVLPSAISNSSNSEIANNETICRIRMIMLNNNKPLNVN